jgi:protein-tyrosine phosphatase
MARRRLTDAFVRTGRAQRRSYQRDLLPATTMKWFRSRPVPEPEMRILMVCMGNICRSPTAEGVLRAKLEQAGLAGRVLVDSAGTHGYHTDEPPDPRAVRQAALRGYELGRLRARPVGPEDFLRFDWLLAMDEDNLAWLNKRAPEGNPGRIELLMPYALSYPEHRVVPDPYYGAAAGFDLVLDLVEDACDGVVRRLVAEHKARELD